LGAQRVGQKVSWSKQIKENWLRNGGMSMDRKWIGALLIFLGMFFLLSNLGIFRGEWALLILGGGFIGVYWASGKTADGRNVGFLIPGCILIMLGFFVILEATLKQWGVEGYFFFSFIGMAFILVYLIHNRQLSDAPEGRRNWPLYPGLSLFGFTLFLFVVTRLDTDIGRMFLNNLFPIGLLVAGAILLLKSYSKKQN